MLNTELEKTKADNVKLYGKIRYVQDYNSEKVISRGSKKVILRKFSFFVFTFTQCILADVSPDFQYAEDLESGFSSDVESKYKKIYEDDINPFAAFSKKVPQVSLSFLSFPLFIYLSLLVFGYHISVRSSCGCAMVRKSLSIL